MCCDGVFCIYSMGTYNRFNNLSARGGGGGGERASEREREIRLIAPTRESGCIYARYTHKKSNAGKERVLRSWAFVCSITITQSARRLK